MSEILLAQLYALKAHLESVIVGVESAQPAPPVACPHPEAKRRDTTLMSGPRKFLCLACGAEVEDPVPV